MKLGVSFSKSLGQAFKEIADDIGREKTRAIDSAGRHALQSVRQATVAAGLGQRLANTWRLVLKPRPGVHRAAIIRSKAPNIVSAFATGVTIRAKNKKFLAVPLPAAGKGPKGHRMTPALFEQSRGIKLRFVQRRKGPALLVADNVRLSKYGRAKMNQTRRKDGSTYTRLLGRTSIPIFLLLPQVRLAKRFDLNVIARDAHAFLVLQLKG